MTHVQKKKPMETGQSILQADGIPLHNLLQRDNSMTKEKKKKKPKSSRELEPLTSKSRCHQKEHRANHRLSIQTHPH
jgi:hypothetical protein